jgi:hypothetical protein
MPITPTYPGVYIEEIPSGVRTITGVATSITAFIGRALRGSTNEPVLINSFADFESRFGGLRVDYPMSYAVRDFYLNGGSQAIIVRLYKGNEKEGTAKLTVGGLALEAASGGEWGNKLSIKVDRKGINDETKARYNLPGSVDLFNLTIIENPPSGSREVIRNVSLNPEAGSRYIQKALLQESRMVRVSTPPTSTAVNDPENTKDNADPTNPDNFKQGATADIKYFEGGQNSQKPLDRAAYEGSKSSKTGLYALEKADLFNLLCIPADTRGEDTPKEVYQTAMEYCHQRRAVLIVDAPKSWTSESLTTNPGQNLTDLGLSGIAARNAVLFFPRVIQSDPLQEGQLDSFVPCGIVAGVMARTDVQRGVWKAPAGLDAALNGIQGLSVQLSNEENGVLNPVGINCLRSFPVYGQVVWGSRTLRGADQLADEYKYLPVRRLALFIEESLYRGTQWVVFEPNDEPLWAQIRLNVGAFMNNLFRQGAFQGSNPREAYFVKCDKETTTENDINLGIVNIRVGFAPLKPAEFVIIQIQQMAGQIAT